MKKYNQMCLFKSTINNNYKDSFLNYLSSLDMVHIKSKKQTKIDKQIAGTNPFIEKVKKLRDNIGLFFEKINISEYTFQDLKIKPNERIKFIVADLNELANHIKEELSFFNNRVIELDRFIAKARIELENITTIRDSYKFLEKLDFKIILSTTDFPMELFLLMGEDYIENNKIGSICHQKRMKFELSISDEIRKDIYNSLASLGIGRSCIVYAKKD